MFEVYSLMIIYISMRIGFEEFNKDLSLINRLFESFSSFLYLFKSFDWIENRFEFVTPDSGFKQLQEGVYLYEEGYDPYDTGIFNQSPILLQIFSFTKRSGMMKSFISNSFIFGSIDCLNSICLLKIFKMMKFKRKNCLDKDNNDNKTSNNNIIIKENENDEDEKDEDDGKKSFLSKFNKSKRESLVDDWLEELEDWKFIALYLFSPINFLSSLSKSTNSFNNFFILLGLIGALENKILLSMFSLSIGTSLSSYPILLVPSCIAIISERRPKLPIIRTIFQSILAFTIHLTLITILGTTSSTPYLSFSFSNLNLTNVTENFLKALRLLYIDRLDVNKFLRPNVGLNWYFSIEMFDHFRKFFNFVFQVHILIYVFPLIFKFKKEKVFAFVIMNGIINTFKSYPTIGDSSFSNVLTFICYPELISYLKHPLLTSLLYLYSFLLLPSFYHLWLNLGSGNSNFYYASTLVLSIGNGLNVIDLLESMIRFQFIRDHLGGVNVLDEVECLVQSS